MGLISVYTEQDNQFIPHSNSNTIHTVVIALGSLYDFANVIAADTQSTLLKRKFYV